MKDLPESTYYVRCLHMLTSMSKDDLIRAYIIIQRIWVRGGKQ